MRADDISCFALHSEPKHDIDCALLEGRKRHAHQEPLLFPREPRVFPSHTDMHWFLAAVDQQGACSADTHDNPTPLA